MKVLDLLPQGDDLKQIAEKLFLSRFTIRAYLRSIYDRLHVHSKSQAVAKALQERLLPKKLDNSAFNQTSLTYIDLLCLQQRHDDR